MTYDYKTTIGAYCHFQKECDAVDKKFHNLNYLKTKLKQIYDLKKSYKQLRFCFKLQFKPMHPKMQIRNEKSPNFKIISCNAKKRERQQNPKSIMQISLFTIMCNLVIKTIMASIKISASLQMTILQLFLQQSTEKNWSIDLQPLVFLIQLTAIKLFL